MKDTVSVKSEKKPQNGQKHRSSGNFSTKDMADAPILWECPDGITFTVMEDKTAASDKTVFKEVRNGCVTHFYNAQNLYIADPKGAKSDFIVKACTIHKTGIEKLRFASIADIHLGSENDLKVSNKDDYNSKDRLNRLKDQLMKRNHTFAIMQGDLTTGTKDGQKGDFEGFAKKMEDDCSLTICEGWGNHDLYYYVGSGNVGNMVKDRNKNRKYPRLPNCHYAADGREDGHLLFRFDINGPVKSDGNKEYGGSIPVYFFNINLFPGKGIQEDKECKDPRNINQKNPFRSQEFLEKYLPGYSEIKDKKDKVNNSVIFVAFHYPKASEEISKADQDWFKGVCQKYPNLYCLVGHNHNTSFLTPKIGYDANTKEFYCAGGMNNFNLTTLSVELVRTGNNNLRINYEWYTNGSLSDAGTKGPTSGKIDLSI